VGAERRYNCMMNQLDFVHRYAPGQPGSSRVLLLLHGTGGDETSMLTLGREFDPTAAMLSPRGKVLENGAPRFFRRFAEGVFDEEDVIRRANELADFVTNAASTYGFHPAEVTAIGYSNGANISAAMMLLRPEVLSAAVMLRAMVPLSNAAASDLTGKRVLISCGETDAIVPADNSAQLAELLRSRGADVSLVVQRAGHGLIPADLTTVKHWLRNAG
jgi:phospholipase/carboxylesterase